MPTTPPGSAGPLRTGPAPSPGAAESGSYQFNLTPPGPPGTVDKDGAGGWRYRLYPDGKIEVIGAPEGHRPGAVLKPGDPAYTAIAKELSGGALPLQRPKELAPPSLDAFQAQQKAPAPTALADMRQRAASHAIDQSGPKGEDYVADGWGYRLFPDGKIKIVMAPEGHRSGATLDGGPAYEAIMSRIKSDYSNKGNASEPSGMPTARQTLRNYDAKEAPLVGPDLGETAMGPDLGETSGVDALIASIPEMSEVSDQPISKSPKPVSERDAEMLARMAPGEGKPDQYAIDYENLLRSP